MNYSININQLAAATHFPELDIIDVAIFDYILKFYPSSDKFSDLFGTWFWVSHSKIISDMPILNIKSKAGIIKRINNLVDSGILIRHQESKKLGRSYYKTGDKFDLLTKVDTSQRKSIDPHNENQEVPHNENQEDYNTNTNPCTNDSLTWRNDFETYKLELEIVYQELINNENWIKQQEKFNPNVDIKLSLEKACTNYWATEAGWLLKKRKKSKEINWKSTLTNAIGMNKVYKPRDEQFNEKSSVNKFNDIDKKIDNLYG